MVKRLLYAMVLPLLLLTLQVGAQDRLITGKVADSSGAPLVNASVVVKGSKTGAQTSAAGSFSLRAPANASRLVISSVGFGTRGVVIGSGSVAVTLQPANAALTEVVVLGYGTQRRRDLTGSVTTVSAEDFQKGQISTPEQLIAGKVAGVSVISNGQWTAISNSI